VTRTRDNVTGNFQLLIDIRRFHVSTSGEAKADIDFVAKVLDQEGKILEAREFSGTAPASGSDAKAYVSAFNEALGKLLKELVDWSIKTIAAVPPPPPPPPPAETPAPEAPPQGEPPAPPQGEPAAPTP
jgi:ABC-type uncharacterized transport system auxiliary subunit